MAYSLMILSYLTTILHDLTIILNSWSNYLPVFLTGLVVVFTALYWWNARRAFLLELDRVLLWFRLEQEITDEETDKILDEEVDEYVIDEMIDKETDKKIDESTLKLNQLDREKLKSAVQKDLREKVGQRIRQRIRKDMRKKMRMDEIAGDEAFLNTLKSKKLAVRIKEWEKQKTLVLNMKKRERERQSEMLRRELSQEDAPKEPS